MGGVAPHTTPVRGHQASLGTICAASLRVGGGSLVLRGPHGSRRLGRGGGSCSGSSLGRGGGPSPLPRGVGAGAPAACGPVGGGGGGVAPRPPCSPSGRRPAVLNPGPLRVAGALPSGVRVRSGPKCRPGVGGVRGGPWTAPPGALADLNPSSALPEWAVVTGGSCGARPPYCSVVRVAPARQCGLAGAGPAAAPPTASPPRLRGGGGPRLWLPSWGGCGGGGGVGGPPPPPALGPEWEGGGGPLVPWRRLLTAGGGGRHGSPGPGGQPSAGGRALPPPPSTYSRTLVQALAGAPHPPGGCRAALPGRGRP